jgi:hypothetical protein
MKTLQESLPIGNGDAALVAKNLTDKVWDSTSERSARARPGAAYDEPRRSYACPLLPQSGHANRADGCPLLGVKQTCVRHR